MDFSRFETAAGGSWNISAVMDYATKLCVAAPITGPRGRVMPSGALRAAIEAAEELLGAPLIGDCVDLETGQIAHLTIVTDNGPAYKSDAFMRFVMARPELEHVKDPLLLPWLERGRRALLPLPQVRAPLPRGDR